MPNYHFVCYLMATVEIQEHLGYDPNYVVSEFGDAPSRPLLFCLSPPGVEPGGGFPVRQVQPGFPAFPPAIHRLLMEGLPLLCAVEVLAQCLFHQEMRLALPGLGERFQPQVFFGIEFDGYGGRVAEGMIF